MQSKLSKRELLRQLPPGPRLPPALQLLGTWLRPGMSMVTLSRRYGRRVTANIPFQPPLVMISDPEEVKEVFKLPPDVAHPGQGARILEPILGSYSLILLDEDLHLEHRRLLLPAFHGDRMKLLVDLMRELTDAELDSWPTDTPVSLHPHLQALTLEVILRAVFGMEKGPRLDDLRETLTGILALADRPLSIILPVADRYLGWVPTMRQFKRLRARSRRLIFDEIRDRRAAFEDGSAGAGGIKSHDVLAMMLAAKHDDESPMSDQEIHDELMTALVAGHETTASQLAWTFMHLARDRRACARLTEELDAGGEDAYLTATINESLRLRPVLPQVEPRYLRKPATIGGFDYPAGVALIPAPYMLHHDPEIYPQPFAFRPERFLEKSPGTYTWIPFGGGRRRCLGAAFAMQEMKIVIGEVLRRFTLEPQQPAGERSIRRSITVSPRQGGTVVLRNRHSGGPLTTAAVQVPVELAA
ncbi:MAG TPA: cytochrome P450 [Solirubrobacteraceae bacterium]|nr:cytochrome P450 [Solirubrobacteraceae bacterium]